MGVTETNPSGATPPVLPPTKGKSTKPWLRGAVTAGAGVVAASGANAAIVSNPDGRIVDSTNPRTIDFNGDTFPEVEIFADGAQLALNKPEVKVKNNYRANAGDINLVAALPIGEAFNIGGTYGTTFIDGGVLVNDSGGEFSAAAGEQFIGMQISLADGEHLAQIGFDVIGAAPGSYSGQITSYAYESDPIPEPTSLALLALGAAGLSAYRGRRNR